MFYMVLNTTLICFLLGLTGDVLENLRVRISDPLGKSAVEKFFEILFWLETTKNDHSRGFRVRGEAASALIVQAMCPCTSQKCHFIPRIALLFSRITLSFPEVLLYFLEWLFCFPEVPFCFLQLAFCFPEVPFCFPEVPLYFSKMPYF